MHRAVFRVDHAPAALGLDRAHGGQRLGQRMAHAAAMRHLVEAVFGHHRTDPQWREQRAETRIVDDLKFLI